MAKLILLVDDDRLPMRFYVRALERSGFEVKHFLEPDGALDFARKRGHAVSMAILDIMMPPGKAYEKQNTNEGLKTGLFLLKDLKTLLPSVPVIVLTNVRNPDTVTEMRRISGVKILQKMDCPPFELTKIVMESLDETVLPTGTTKEEGDE